MRPLRAATRQDKAGLETGSREINQMRLASLAILASCAFAQDAHAGHDHSVNPYDWAGIFATPAASHTFTVQEVNGKVRLRGVHPTICLCILAIFLGRHALPSLPLTCPVLKTLPRARSTRRIR